MSKRFVLTLLCSALFIPFTLQTASAQPSCDAASLRRALHQTVELQGEKARVASLLSDILRAIYNRGEGAAIELLEELERLERAAEYHNEQCRLGKERSCEIARRIGAQIEALYDAIDLLRDDITAAMNAVLTRFNNITEKLDSELSRLRAFIRECLPSGR